MNRFKMRALTGAFAALILSACGDDSPQKTQGDDSPDAGSDTDNPDGSTDESDASENPAPVEPDGKDPQRAAKFERVYYSDAFGTHRVDVAGSKTEKLSDRAGVAAGFVNSFLVSPAETYLADVKKVVHIDSDELVFDPQIKSGNANIQLFVSDSTLIYQIFGQQGFKEVSLKDNSERDITLPYDYCTITPESFLSAKKLLAVACRGKVALWDTEARTEASADAGDSSHIVTASAWLDDSHFAFGTGEGLYIHTADLSPAFSKPVGKVGGVIRGGPGKAWFTQETVGSGGLRISAWQSVDVDGNITELPWLTALNAIPANVVVSEDGTQVLIWTSGLKLYDVDGSNPRDVAPGPLVGFGVAR